MRLYITKNRGGLSEAMVKYKVNTWQGRRAFCRWLVNYMQVHHKQTVYIELFNDDPISVYGEPLEIVRADLLPSKYEGLKFSEGIL